MRKTVQHTKQNAAKKAGQRREYAILIALLIPVGFGAFFMFGTTNHADQAVSESTSTILSQQLQQGLDPTLKGSPKRALPARYEIKGTVDDQYTLAVDPKTGETLINDSLGSIGTNNTSVDGDRAKLAREMVALENYTNSNKDHLPVALYNWLKKVARTGMHLAFGTPGLSPNAQPALKKELLAAFHEISANPTDTILHTDQYLSLERVFEQPEAAYLADDSVMDKTNFLQTDPVSPALNTFDPAVDSTVLASKLVGQNLEPSFSSLALADSPFNYVSQPPEVNPVIPPRPQTIKIPPPGQITSNTPTTKLNPSSTPKAGGSSPTIEEYYNTTLGIGSTKANTVAVFRSIATSSTSNSVKTSSPATTTTTVTTATTPNNLIISLGSLGSISIQVSSSSTTVLPTVQISVQGT